jgi:hypothetical protein
VAHCVLTSSTSKTEQPLSMVAHRLSVHQNHGERTTRPLSMVAHCLSHDQQQAEAEEKGMADENQQEEKEEMVDQPVSNHDQGQQEETEEMVDQPENHNENQQEETEEMVDQLVSNHDQDQQEETEEMVDQPENQDENLVEEKDEMYDQPLSMVAHCVALYQQQQLINHDSAEEKTVISYTAESDDVSSSLTDESSVNVNCVEVAPCGSDDSHQQLTQQQLYNNDDSCQPAADQNITTLMKKASYMDESETAAEREDCMIAEADSMENGGQIEDQATKEVEAVEVERLGGVTASRRESEVEEEDLEESAVVFTLSLGQLHAALLSIPPCLLCARLLFFLRVYRSIKLEITYIFSQK